MNGAQDKPFVAFDPWDPTSHVPDPREQLTAPRPVVLSTSQLEAAEEIRARAAASVYADHSDAAAAADAGADFVESDRECRATWRMAGEYDTKRCDLEAGHDGAHSAQDGSTLHLDGVEMADLRTGPVYPDFAKLFTDLRADIGDGKPKVVVMERGPDVAPVEDLAALTREIRDGAAAFIESALGATPTVAEMTADLGKLTLPEVIFVKDCECASRPRFSTKAGDPTCEECGKAWTRTYGPSNDAPPEVQIEIRAAELAYSPSFRYTDEEWSGWCDYDAWRRDDAIPETDSNWVGYLSAAVEDHDQEHPPDGQRNAIRDLANEGLA